MSQAAGHHHVGHGTSAPPLAGKVIAMSRHESQPIGNGSIPPALGGRQLPSDEELREISASLRGLRFGSVNIVVQDGVIIQIDRVEKRRLRTRRGADDSGQ